MKKKADNAKAVLGPAKSFKFSVNCFEVCLVWIQRKIGRIAGVRGFFVAYVFKLVVR